MTEIKYRSSTGNEYNLVGDMMRVTEGTLHKYTWDRNVVENKSGEKVKEFVKKAATYTLTINFRGTLEERKTLLNAIRDDFEHDIINRIPGTFIYGKYYINGYVVESETQTSEIKYTWSQDKVQIYCPYPWWIKETHYDFYASDIYNGSSKKYAYRYPYRYGGGLTGDYIINEYFDKVDFKMVIFDPVVNPLVIIGGHKYQINILLETGEYLELDTEKGTVIKVMNSGQAVNAFHNREKSSDPFAPIIPGRHTVEWTGKFDWNITLYAKRSEPEWQ